MGGFSFFVLIIFIWIQLSKTKFYFRLFNPSFEKQCRLFGKLGFLLNDGVTTSDIKEQFSTFDFIKFPNECLYAALGCKIHRPPFTTVTNQCIFINAERFGEESAYSELLKRISILTQNQLKFDEIECSINFEKKQGVISFQINGQKKSWELLVDNDWIDGTLFDRIIELNNILNNEKRFTFLSAFGQCYVLSYCNENEFIKFNESTKLGIEWLNPAGQLYT